MRQLTQLVENILAGTRAASFLKFHLWSFKAGFAQVFILFGVSVFLTFIHDYVSTLPDNQFNPLSLGHQGLLYLLFFFSLLIVAACNRRLQHIDKLVVMLLSIVPVIWLGTLGLIYLMKLQHWLSEYQASWLVFVVYVSWYVIVVFRLFRRFFYISNMPALGWVVFYAVINFAPIIWLPGQPIWLSKYVPEYRPTVEPIDIEAVYHDQERLMDNIQNTILNENHERTDVYFVGFAGHATEDVFMNEVVSAANIVKDRFSAYGKTALLINNRDSIDQYPLANRFNLRRLLMTVSERMDRENDILFLFLSSHGSEDHQLSTAFPRFRLKDITPDMLKSRLDASGIKWKIIVISACYSGGFIDALSDAGTLIITAARPDRNSFGCGHDGNYTFFGEAYFEQGIKQQLGLIDAFEAAKAAIYEKEQAESFTHSEPQIYIGEEIEVKLEQLEQELRQYNNNNWATSTQGLLTDSSALSTATD